VLRSDAGLARRHRLQRPQEGKVAKRRQGTRSGGSGQEPASIVEAGHGNLLGAKCGKPDSILARFANNRRSRGNVASLLNAGRSILDAEVC
jgi:hypothetical protein